jgi:hypothetical protein
LARIKTSASYRVDEDVTYEIQLLESWLNGRGGSDEVAKLKLDPRRAASFASMMNPPEYEMPFLL